MVNTHVTAPAGLMALSLIHLRTNDKKLANSITIPDSFAGI